MKITTIIAVHDGAAYLAEALESVFRQEHRPLEVIVVDDGSSDGSGQIAREFDGTIVIETEHRGVAAARNTGLAAATGELIAFLDADDRWEPGKLATQVAYLEERPKLDGVFGWMRNFLEPGIDIPDWLRRDQLDADTPGHSLCTLLVRLEVFDRVGPFDPSRRSGEDGDWFFRASDLGVRFEMIEERFLMRRIHDRNLSHDGSAVRAGILSAARESLRRKRSL